MKIDVSTSVDSLLPASLWMSTVDVLGGLIALNSCCSFPIVPDFALQKRFLLISHTNPSGRVNSSRRAAGEKPSCFNH